MARRRLISARIWEVARGVLSYFETKLGFRSPQLEQEAKHHIVQKMRINRRDDIDYVNSVVNRVQASRKAAKELNTTGRIDERTKLEKDDRIPPNSKGNVVYEVAVTMTDPTDGSKTQTVTYVTSSTYMTAQEIRDMVSRESEMTWLGPIPPGWSVPVLESVEVIGVSGTVNPETPF